MTWLPQAKEALDRAERIALGRMEIVSTTLDQIRSKRDELDVLKAQLDEVIQDIDPLEEGSTEKALKGLSREYKRLKEEFEKVTTDSQERLAAAEAKLATEVQERNSQRSEHSQELGRVRAAHETLKGDLQRTRGELERLTAVRETRVAAAEDRTQTLENVLRDVHHALLHQPDETRENIASMIARIVEPYTEGERPQ